jgi:hypothetical protein
VIATTKCAIFDVVRCGSAAGLRSDKSFATRPNLPGRIRRAVRANFFEQLESVDIITRLPGLTELVFERWHFLPARSGLALKELS